MILRATGWDVLSPGTLNLEVDEQVVDGLISLRPVIREPGSEVRYPEPYQHIPQYRIAYLYFRGSVRSDAGSEDVLFRTTENPLRTLIEAIAPLSLRKRLGLLDGDRVDCRAETGLTLDT